MSDRHATTSGELPRFEDVGAPRPQAPRAVLEGIITRLVLRRTRPRRFALAVPRRGGAGLQWKRAVQDDRLHIRKHLRCAQTMDSDPHRGCGPDSRIGRAGGYLGWRF